jgi:hypothetical protein
MPPRKNLKPSDLAAIETSMKRGASNLIRLLEMRAPEIMKFNEFKHLEILFEEWCSLKRLDHKREWMDDKIDREKLH